MKVRLDENNIKWGITAFLVIVCSVLVIFSIIKFEAIKAGYDTVMGIMSPFIWGFVIAYLLCPIYNMVVRHAYAMLNKTDKRLKNDLFIAKTVGTLVSMLVLIIVIAGISWMIIPGLYDSIINIVNMLPSGKAVFIDWLNARFVKFPTIQARVAQYVNSSTDHLIDFATQTFLPHYSSIAVGISSGIIGAVNLLKNFVIGIIISVYFLNSKDVFAGQIKKLIYATMKESKAEGLLELARFTNKAFGGFISGKLIDSAIIGLICFIIMNIFGWEYSLLISCIIGITNIIPFFGPFIGAIPSALLLVMVHPMHAVYFIIFVILLQQFDGNILGPKILGESTGLGSFWVLFAVLVGGGLFGMVGMIIAIPVFAVMYFYITKFVNNRLADRGFSTSLVDYKIDSYRSTGMTNVEPTQLQKTFIKIKSLFIKSKKDDEDDE